MRAAAEFEVLRPIPEIGAERYDVLVLNGERLYRVRRLDEDFTVRLLAGDMVSARRMLWRCGDAVGGVR